MTLSLVDTGADGYNNSLTGILVSKLASSGGKCSAFRDWNFISGKTECKMGQMYRARKKEKKIKAVCG